MVSRDTRSCSWPEASIWASSVMAGTWRNSRSASKRRCSSVPSDHGSCVVQPTWLSISVMNCSILAGGAFGLLALDADQRGLVLLVREPDLEHAVGDQRENDHGDKQRDVFDEQPAAHDRGADRAPRRRRGDPSARGPLSRCEDPHPLSFDHLSIFRAHPPPHSITSSARQ